LKGEGTGLDLADDWRKLEMHGDFVITSGNFVIPLGSAQHPYLRKPYTFQSFTACLAPFLLAPKRRRRSSWSQFFGSFMVFATMIMLGSLEQQYTLVPVLETEGPTFSRWNNVWESAAVKSGLQSLLDPQSELNLLVYDPRFVEGWEKFKRL
jgi:hypothetical protein